MFRSRENGCEEEGHTGVCRRHRSIRPGRQKPGGGREDAEKEAYTAISGNGLQRDPFLSEDQPSPARSASGGISDSSVRTLQPAQQDTVVPRFCEEDLSSSGLPTRSTIPKSKCSKIQNYGRFVCMQCTWRQKTLGSELIWRSGLTRKMRGHVHSSSQCEHASISRRNSDA